MFLLKMASDLLISLEHEPVISQTEPPAHLYLAVGNSPFVEGEVKRESEEI